MVEVLIRRPRDNKPYRMKMRFVTPAFPHHGWVDEMKVKMAERWITDMEKMGWTIVEKHGFRLTGPYPATEIMVLPKPEAELDRWHIPSKELLPAIMQGYRGPERSAQNGGYARNVPTLQETENWEFQLEAVFYTREILTEIPDPHEEEEGRKKR